MKAALVLMAAACMTGDHPAPAHAPAAPVVSHSSGSCCGSGCTSRWSCGCYDSCCEREGFFSRLRGRLGGLFNRGGDCCDTGCYTSCHTTCTNCCCDSGWSFGSRLRGLFRRDRCDYGCCNTCCGTVVHPPHPGGPEKVEIKTKPAPKKMPNPPGDGKKDASTGGAPVNTEPPLGNTDVQIQGNPVPPIPNTTPEIPSVVPDVNRKSPF